MRTRIAVYIIKLGCGLWIQVLFLDVVTAEGEYVHTCIYIYISTYTFELLFKSWDSIEDYGLGCICIYRHTQSRNVYVSIHL